MPWESVTVLILARRWQCCPCCSPRQPGIISCRSLWVWALHIYRGTVTVCLIKLNTTVWGEKVHYWGDNTECICLLYRHEERKSMSIERYGFNQSQVDADIFFCGVHPHSFPPFTVCPTIFMILLTGHLKNWASPRSNWLYAGSSAKTWWKTWREKV